MDPSQTTTQPALRPPPNVFGGMLGGFKLRESVNKPRKITDYPWLSICEERGKTPTDRIREMDNIRMHTPVQEEVDFLNVSSYRMNLLTMQDVLYLCGGLVGVRFEPAEFTELLSLHKSMTEHWNILIACFQEMGPVGKKQKLSSLEDEKDKEVHVRFHKLADEYCELFGQLQKIMITKQKDVDPEKKLDAPKLDADPESKMGRSKPQWLTTLMEKYENHKLALVQQLGAPGAASPAGATTSGQESSKPSPTRLFKVGEFSVFLSDCMLSELSGMSALQLSNDESESLSILVQASNDTVMNVSNSDITNTLNDSVAAGGTAVPSAVNGQQPPREARPRAGSPTIFARRSGQVSTRRYWATRFYKFLSGLNELKSAIKDECTLETI